MTLRRRLSTRDRVRIFEAAGERCHICGERIVVGERWDADHVTPLELGGDDDLSNLAPAHERCHRDKTREDVGRIRKAQRCEARHIGAKAPSRRPIAGSRASGWKRPMDPRKPAERR